MRLWYFIKLLLFLSLVVGCGPSAHEQRREYCESKREEYAYACSAVPDSVACEYKLYRWCLVDGIW